MTGTLVRKDDHRAAHTAEAVGGLGAVALGARNKAPEALDSAFRRVNQRVYGPRLERLGTTGALDPRPGPNRGKPVDPKDLVGGKGAPKFAERGGRQVPVGRRDTERQRGQKMYGSAAHPLKQKLARTTLLTTPRSRLAVRALGGPVLLGAGATAAYHGIRSLAPERTSKAVDRTDIDAAAAGGAAAAAGYWGPQYAYSQGPDKVLRVNRMKANPAQQARWDAHLDSHGMRRGNHPKGDPAWVKVYRDYPKDLPGWRTQRGMSHLFAGRKGLALTAGATAAGAVLGVRHGRKHDQVPGAVTARRAADVAFQGARGVRERVHKGRGRLVGYAGAVAEEASRRASKPMEEAIGRAADHAVTRIDQAATGAQARMNNSVRVGDTKRSVKYGMGLALGGAAAISGGQTLGAVGQRRVNRERVRKDDYDLGLSPQYGVGIPATRSNPISPLAMLASSNIMADAMIGASGKRVTRRQRKTMRGQAYAFNMGRGMVFSPLGHGQVSTG